MGYGWLPRLEMAEQSIVFRERLEAQRLTQIQIAFLQESDDFATDADTNSYSP